MVDRLLFSFLTLCFLSVVNANDDDAIQIGSSETVLSQSFHPLTPGVLDCLSKTEIGRSFYESYVRQEREKDLYFPKNDPLNENHKQFLRGIAHTYAQRLVTLCPEMGTFFGYKIMDPSTGQQKTWDGEATRITLDFDERCKNLSQDQLTYLFEKRLENLVTDNAHIEVLASIDALIQVVATGLFMQEQIEETGQLTVFIPFLFPMMNPLDPYKLIFMALSLNYSDDYPERAPNVGVRLRKYIYPSDSGEPAFISGVHAFLQAKCAKRRAASQPIVMPIQNHIDSITGISTATLCGDSIILFCGKFKSLWKGFSTTEETASLIDVFIYLRPQKNVYNQFLTTLPNIPKESLLPKTLYCAYLANHGVYDTPENLMQKGRTDFNAAKEERETIARRVASAHGWGYTNPVDILNRLKESTRISNEDDYAEMCKRTVTRLKRIVAENRLCPISTLPFVMRSGNIVENTAMPAPHVEPGCCFQDHLSIDDIKPSTFVFGNWDSYCNNPITAASFVAHECIPGHQNHFNWIRQQGKDAIRGGLAWNWAAIEGWGLSCEQMVYPYLTDDEKLGSFEFWMLRILRFFADPAVNTGQMTIQELKQMLMEDVGVNEKTANIEISRYTELIPGQAPCYYWGYLKIKETAEKLKTEPGDIYTDYDYHKAIMDLGLMPVQENYAVIKAYMERSAMSESSQTQTQTQTENSA